MSSRQAVCKQKIDRQPLVSVVIPFRNANLQFMREAIESIRQQSYKKWELLLVDDGSTDESTALAKAYTRQYPGQVRYLEHANHRNRGISASRQLGADHAAGVYTALMDADDMLLPHKLEQQVAILETHPEVGMVYGKTLYWYSWTGHAEDTRPDFMPMVGVAGNSIVQPPLLLPHFLLGKAAVPCTCSVLVRRAVVKQVGGFEATFPGLYDDQVFYAKVCLKVPVYVADVCWDHYRQHPDSICAITKDTAQSNAARIRYLHWLAGYLEAERVTDAAVWLAVRKALWLLDDGPKWLPFAAGSGSRVRQVKKWLLRFEEALVPNAIRYRLWGKTFTINL